MSAALAPITLPSGRVLQPASAELIAEGRRLALLEHRIPRGGGKRDSHNLELLVEVLQYADEERAINKATGRESNFEMSDWFDPGVRGDITGDKLAGKNLHAATCGTAACLAGTAALMTLQPGERMVYGAIYPASLPVAHNPWDNSPVVDGKLLSSVSKRGREVLGLTQNQASALFLATTGSVLQLRHIASAITGYDLTWVDEAAVKTAVRREKGRLRKSAAREAQKASA